MLFLKWDAYHRKNKLLKNLYENILVRGPGLKDKDGHW